MRGLATCPRIARLGLLLLAAPLTAADPGGRVEYIGGTVEALARARKGRLDTTHKTHLMYHAGKTLYAVPWDSINLLEYGQRVGRRYAMAVLISPLLILSKTRKHFLTIGFVDEEGQQQALIFRVEKDDIRPLLVSLEARTNVRVEYQDEEARKAGKG